MVEKFIKAFHANKSELKTIASSDYRWLYPLLEIVKEYGFLDKELRKEFENIILKIVPTLSNEWISHFEGLVVKNSFCNTPEIENKLKERLSELEKAKN